MEQDQHLEFHLICIGLFALLNYFVRMTNDWWMFLILIPTWFINPDIDKAFDKESDKVKLFLKKIHLDKKAKIYHRNFLTHSIVPSLVIYLSLRHFVACNFGTGVMWEVAIWCFFPVLIHLVGDLKFWGTIDLEFDEFIKNHVKKDQKVDRKEFGGTWQISLQPFSSKRLGYKGTMLWIYLNIAIMLTVIIFLYFFP